MATAFKKDPSALLDYTINWQPVDNPWLEMGETIASSIWLVPDGLVKESDVHDDTTTTVWISGGAANTRYKISNQITSSLGRVDERSFYINVIEMFV